jgi:hypothetical protein
MAYYAEDSVPTMLSLLLFYALVFDSPVGFFAPAVPTMSAASPILLTTWLLKAGGLLCTL